MNFLKYIIPLGVIPLVSACDPAYILQVSNCGSEEFRLKVGYDQQAKQNAFPTPSDFEDTLSSQEEVFLWQDLGFPNMAEMYVVYLLINDSIRIDREMLLERMEKQSRGNYIFQYSSDSSGSCVSR